MAQARVRRERTPACAEVGEPPGVLESASVAVAEVEQYGSDPSAHDLVVLERELLEDSADMLLDRSLREDQRLRDRGVALALGHLGQGLMFTRCEVVEWRVAPAPVRGDQPLDDGGVDPGPGRRDGADGGALAPA